MQGRYFPGHPCSDNVDCHASGVKTVKGNWLPIIVTERKTVKCFSFFVKFRGNVPKQPSEDPTARAARRASRFVVALRSAPNLKKAVPARESHWSLTPQRGCQLAVRGRWTTQIGSSTPDACQQHSSTSVWPPKRSPTRRRTHWNVGRHWASMLESSEVLELWFLMAIRMLMVVVVLLNEKQQAMEANQERRRKRRKGNTTKSTWKEDLKNLGTKGVE